MSNKWTRWLAANGRTTAQLSRKQGWDTFVFAAPREDFAVLSRDEMAALSSEELEDYNEARMVWNANLPTVKTAQLTEAYGIIDQVMASGRRDADRLRGSVVIDAEPGLGKTTIATRYARDFTAASIAEKDPQLPRGTSACRWPSFRSAPGSPSRASISRFCGSTAILPWTAPQPRASEPWLSIA